MKDKTYLALFAIIWTFMAVVIALHSLVYYSEYSLPFGRLDVDNYIGTTYEWITGEKYTYSHILFMISGELAYKFGIKPELLFSVVMPLAISLVPVSVFIFYLYLLKRIKTTFVSCFFMMFGTFSMFSFWIMSLWAQAISTAFLMIGIIFYYIAETKDKRYYLVFAAMVVLAMLSHHVSPLMLMLFLLVKFIDERKKLSIALVVLLIIIGMIATVFVVKKNLFDPTYPYSVGVGYIFENAAFPLLWVLSLWGMFVSRKNSRLRVLSWFTVLGVLLSSQFVLWRPISTMLCFVAVFAGIGFVEIIDRMSRFSAAFISVLMFVILLNYAFVQYNGFMNMMLWEMVDNSPDVPRGMDPEPFRVMFFSGTEITTRGYITPFSNSTHETSAISKNGTVLPII